MIAHLSEKTAALLDLSDKERIHHIRKPVWVGYTQAKVILDKLEDLFEYPDQSRMPNMLIVGESNNGKTALVERFHQRHLAYEREDRSGVEVPVLLVQAPPGPDEEALYSMILNRLFERNPSSEPPKRKRERVLKLLKRLGLRMIIIDEIHNLLAGPTRQQRHFLNVLKFLGNELRVPIVGVGTGDAARAVQIDPQIGNRFIPVAVPRWKMGVEWGRLLASFEKLIPLQKASNLSSKEMAIRLLSKTGGNIGELSSLLSLSATYAIKENIECIDYDVLKASGYVSPSERKMVAKNL